MIRLNIYRMKRNLYIKNVMHIMHNIFKLRQLTSQIEWINKIKQNMPVPALKFTCEKDSISFRKNHFSICNGTNLNIC